MKNIFKMFYFHPLYLLFLIIVILTGHFNNFLTFNLLILIHECGHIITALLFKWQIKKIVILPYGMITIFDNNLNKPIYQEFLILIMGPILQIIFNYFYPNNYHYFILFINLLPIYPLDGSKLIFLMFNKLFSYYKSYILTYIISIIVIIICFLIRQDLLIILMLLYLSYNLIIHIKNLSKIILAFCFDRFKHQYKFKKSKKVFGMSPKLLFRDYYHYFIYQNKMLNESEFLSKMFDK